MGKPDDDRYQQRKDANHHYRKQTLEGVPDSQCGVLALGRYYKRKIASHGAIPFLFLDVGREGRC